MELVDTESLVPQEYLLRKVDNPKNQRYAMSVCALRSVPRSDGIPSRCWSSTILNSTTGSILGRCISALTGAGRWSPLPRGQALVSVAVSGALFQRRFYLWRRGQRLSQLLADGGAVSLDPPTYFQLPPQGFDGLIDR